MIHWQTYPPGSPELGVCRSWHAGRRLTDTVRTSPLKPAQVVRIYRQLYRQGEIKDSPERQRRAAHFAAQAKQKHIDNDTDYARWKGWTGPGKQLRDIVKEANRGKD